MSTDLAVFVCNTITLIGCDLKNFKCLHLILNIVQNMYIVISDNNETGTFTGTNLNYIHNGLILTLSVQTILAHIFQLIMQVMPTLEQT